MLAALYHVGPVVCIAPSLSDRHPMNSPSPAAAALRVLYVEDDDDIRMAFVDIVEDSGHLVVAVATAEDAVQALTQQPFDVTITDLTLPKMSGMELSRHIQAVYPAMRLVIASGAAAPVGDPVLKPGVMFLRKPYDIAAMETLLAGIAETLSN
ncbi:MAG: sensory box histidine kinase/response regulator [Rhizobacter sp.]|nr:sensory box histidine kinase/response regulator [Rhizobacter sp.]